MPPLSRAQADAAAAPIADDDHTAPGTPFDFDGYVQQAFANFRAAPFPRVASGAGEPVLTHAYTRVTSTGAYLSVRRYSHVGEDGQRREWVEETMAAAGFRAPPGVRMRLGAAEPAEGQIVELSDEEEGDEDEEEGEEEEEEEEGGEDEEDEEDEDEDEEDAMEEEDSSDEEMSDAAFAPRGVALAREETGASSSPHPPPSSSCTGS